LAPISARLSAINAVMAKRFLSNSNKPPQSLYQIEAALVGGFFVFRHLFDWGLFGEKVFNCRQSINDLLKALLTVENRTKFDPLVLNGDGWYWSVLTLSGLI
jgi:hypothetical protein